jgi:predicted glycoside hydrolase/deacetylase ChbG (UPF0249 family)
MRAALRRLGVATADAFLGDAARRPAWDEAALLEALRRLPEGVTELMAHPGYRPSHAVTSFGLEREVELAALLSPAAREAVQAGGIEPCTYAALGGHPQIG